MTTTGWQKAIEMMEAYERESLCVTQTAEAQAAPALAPLAPAIPDDDRSSGVEPAAQPHDGPHPTAETPVRQIGR